MADDKKYSQGEILAIIKQVNQENFILANAARMVYFAGFHKNEIENIKIKDVSRITTVLSRIEPFLKKGRKAYTSLPIILDAWPRRILSEHIRQLKGGRYAINDEAPLFPNPTKKSYNPKTLHRHFQEYFKDITFDDLRKFGIEREQRRLKAKYGNTQKYQDELLKYSRHSRPSTTQQLIEGKVQRAGKREKKNLPWEIVVKMIERIPRLRKAPKNIYAYAIDKIISSRIEEKDVKESLDALLNVYKQKLNIK
jgi:integrase